MNKCSKPDLEQRGYVKTISTQSKETFEESQKEVLTSLNALTSDGKKAANR